MCQQVTCSLWIWLLSLAWYADFIISIINSPVALITAIKNVIMHLQPVLEATIALSLVIFSLLGVMKFLHGKRQLK
jgi:hypothetical protein